MLHYPSNARYKQYEKKIIFLLVLSFSIISCSVLFLRRNNSDTIPNSSHNETSYEIKNQKERLNSELDPSIKLEYFDDLIMSWGTPDSEVIQGGGYSEYGERTKPIPMSAEEKVIIPVNETIIPISDEYLKGSRLAFL